MVTIGVDQLLSNSDLEEHRCLENIKKLYKSAGKCDNQSQYNSIINSTMVSTYDILIENIPLGVVM